MREKSKKNDLQSEDKELPEGSVAEQGLRVMSFDVYFRKMQAMDPKIHAHHKAPMKRFAEQNGLQEATEEQFAKIFRSY